MLRTLLAGISGLRSHQARMDVIGNNIANVNTIGFKASRITFKEALARTLRSGTTATFANGGVDPLQIGTGTRIGSVDPLFTQGGLEATGRSLDLAVLGDGLFVLGGGDSRLYSRAGDFHLDATGRLVAGGTGLAVLGVSADSGGDLAGSGSLGEIRIRLDQQSPARATEKVTISGNLDAGASVQDTHTTEITIYDRIGQAHRVRLDFTNVGPGTWSWTPSCETAAVGPGSAGTVVFDDEGNLLEFTYPDGAAGLVLSPERGGALEITISAGTVGEGSGLSGYARDSNASLREQDGRPAGELARITIDGRGTILGVFTNGETTALARIALATFQNVEGLLMTDAGLYEVSPNSGDAIVGFAGDRGSSSLLSGYLEGSNVDIAAEFSSMIIAQRGFQANARVISTTDEMLAELINLRR